jgi:adenylyl- and sulfurtransferase ThiI
MKSERVVRGAIDAMGNIENKLYKEETFDRDAYDQVNEIKNFLVDLLSNKDTQKEADKTAAAVEEAKSELEKFKVELERAQKKLGTLVSKGEPAESIDIDEVGKVIQKTSDPLAKLRGNSGGIK